MAKAQTRASNKYAAKAYDRIAWQQGTSTFQIISTHTAKLTSARIPVRPANSTSSTQNSAAKA